MHTASQKNLNGLIKSFTSLKEPWFTSRGFFIHIIYIFALSSIFASGIAKWAPPFILWNTIQSNIIFFWIFFLTPSLCYSVLFIFFRSWLNLDFSNRVNIVLAYNTSAMPVSYNDNYNNFIGNFNNTISKYNLGDFLKVIVRPSDMRFPNDEIAEKHTHRSSLKAATVIIHGSITKRKKRHIVNTKLSHEFWYPAYIAAPKAKIIFYQILKWEYTGEPLLRQITTDIESDIFSEEILFMSLYILGCDAYSLWKTRENSMNIDELTIDRIERLFNGSKQIYELSDTASRSRMQQTINAIDKILQDVYLTTAINLNYTSRWSVASIYCEKVLTIDQYNYLANCAAVWCWEEMGDTSKAKLFNLMATKRPLKEAHLHILNQAYWHVKEGDYFSAINLYDSIPDYTDINIINEQSCLDRMYRSTKLPEFRFIEGYEVLRWKSDGEEEGRKILLDFFELAKQYPEKYKILVDKAKSLFL